MVRKIFNIFGVSKVWAVVFLAVLILIPVVSGTASLVLSKSHAKTAHAIVMQTLPTPTAVATLIPATKTSQAQNTIVFPTAKLTATPTPAPTKTATDTTPPVITSMTGPATGSTVTFSSFCFPIVASDNVSSPANMQVRTQFDSTTWTDWSNNFSPCFSNVSNGGHAFAAQVKDQAGNISTTASRTFAVAVVQNITVSVTGHLFADTNCNDVRDPGEGDIANDPTTVNAFIMPQYSIYLTGNTDANGQFTLSKSIPSTDSITLTIGPVAPSGYKSHATQPTVTLSQSSASTNVDIPFVPYTDVNLCK